MENDHKRGTFMYKIFDMSLPDAYIKELSSLELTLLIEEAKAEHMRLENEIDSLMWMDSPRLEMGPNMPLPSEYAYDPMLYSEEIEDDPTMEQKLRVAKELAEKVGLVLAVLGSAQTQRAKVLNLEAKVERERERA
jgi:hypothetical protein